MIKAPYNFVPLAQKIVFPEWADKVSIDKPFQDGISGTIDVRYTAQTPLFIGNGKGENNTATANYKSANGKYAIPGSSLRGMLRNVIEIASFGKFNRVSDAALSVRDLNNRDLYSSRLTKTLGSKNYEALSKGGWLDFDEKANAWVLYPVRYHRIEDEDIAHFYKFNPQLLKDGKNKEFEKRISLVKHKSVYFSAGENIGHEHHDGMILHYSKVERVEETSFPGAKHGYMVLTGQPGRRYNSSYKREIGKHLDFVFEDRGTDQMAVVDEMIRQFRQANASKAADQKKGFDLTRLLRFCKDIGYPAIPVFYIPNGKGEPDSLGLSQMYRLPYKYTLHDAINNSSENNFSEKMDFAECIFGRISNKKNMSLRGRVQFEDAVAKNAELDKRVDTILGNPKPTYYPNYITQDRDKQEYKTLMDNDVRLRGWKRYPVKNAVNPIKVGEKDQENVASHFTPLKKGSVFEGRIHFHNLKKEELGALLWAITWGGNANLSHSVGMGKPYGYGQIKADISSLSYLENDSDGNEYKDSSAEERSCWTDSFAGYMEKQIPGWKTSSQLKELKAMAEPKNAERRGWDLSHMSLKDENRKNQFVESKKEKTFLAHYSEDNQESHLRQDYQSNGGRGNGGRWDGNRKSSAPAPKVTHSENGIANNSVQVCVLLEEKTKKGGWKVKVKDTPDISGAIVNSSDVPADKKAGDEIKLKVMAVMGASTNFRYEGA